MSKAQDLVQDIAQESEKCRRDLIARIEELTGRNVINYSATAMGAPGEIMMTPDIVNLTRVMAKSAERRGVDLVLNSSGGLPETAEKIILTLRHYYDDDLRVIVPEFAKSAATIVCLGSDAILMGFCSELGPIDPQVATKDGQGNMVFRSAHAIIESVDAYLRKAHDAIKAGEPFEGYIRLLDFHPDLTFVEECRLAQKLSEQIAERWLKAKMLAKNPARATDTARILSRADELFSHGRAIDHRYAKDELGLNVEYYDQDSDLWEAIWELHIRCHLSHFRDGHVKIIESAHNTMAFGR